MSELKALITREIKAVMEQIRGRVVSPPKQANFDIIGFGEFAWLVDVDIGSDSQLLRDVPIKINGPKARFYAAVDSPVFLAKDSQGRYQVIGPADKAPEQGNLCLLDEDDGIVTPSGFIGFRTVRQAFNFYEGTGIPGGSLWNDGVHGFPEITNLDADGNEV